MSASLIEVATTVELEARLPFLKPSWYFGLLFSQGWAFGRVQAREFTNITPYALGPVSARGNLSDWNPIPERGVVSPRYLLSPQKKQFIYQIFWGGSPSDVRFFTQYPPRADNRVLITRLDLTGDIGYITGRESPFNAPSPKTEIWTIYTEYPQFQVFNPTNAAVDNVLMNFLIGKYTYTWVKARELIRDFIEDRRKVHKVVMGPPDAPMDAPSWLVEDYGSALFAFSKEVAL